jgi:WD40 repeat protein
MLKCYRLPSSRSKGRLLRAAVMLSLLASSARAADQPVSFVRDIAPILQANCISCHSQRLKDGELAVDTHASLLKGGESGAVVVPGKSKESPLATTLRETDDELRMPKETAALNEVQIRLLERWIDAGAASDAPSDFVIKPLVPALPVVVPNPRHLVVQLASLGKDIECVFDYGPAAPATAVVFSPDGNLLAVGGYRTVMLWNLQTGKLERVLDGFDDRVYALSFAPGGKLLAAGGWLPGEPGETRIVEVGSGKVLRTLGEHRDSVYAVDISADGKWLATGGADGQVKVWQLADGKLAHSIKEHAGWIYALAFSPDSQFLASGSADKTVRTFKVGGKWERVANYQQDQDVWGLAFSPDGKQLAAAVGGPSDKAVHLRTRADGKETRVLKGHADIVLDTSWSHDGKWIASASGDKLARIFDAQSGALKFKLAGHQSWVYSATFSPDSKLLATGDADGSVRLWRVADGKPLATLVPVSSKSDSGLLVTSTGYYSESTSGTAANNQPARPLPQWRRGTVLLPSDKLRPILARPDLVAEVLRGTSVQTPKLPK